MVESSKILTVSYGTFSCTLEGFEDSFSTMKAIAEYFRDLAADDRYFGAEPPVPDAEMLSRIAAREIDRQVEARTSAEGIHLRAAPEDAVPAVPAMPPVASPPAAAAVAAEEEDTLAEVDSHLMDTPTDADAPLTDDISFAGFTPIADMPQHPDPSSVAAKLQRIQAVVGKTDALADEDYADDAVAEDIKDADEEEVKAETAKVDDQPAPDASSADDVEGDHDLAQTVDADAFADAPNMDADADTVMEDVQTPNDDALVAEAPTEEDTETAAEVLAEPIAEDLSEETVEDVTEDVAEDTAEQITEKGPETIAEDATEENFEDETDAQISQVLRNLERAGATVSDDVDIKPTTENTRDVADVDVASVLGGIAENTDAPQKEGAETSHDAPVQPEPAAPAAPAKPSLRARILRVTKKTPPAAEAARTPKATPPQAPVAKPEPVADLDGAEDLADLVAAGPATLSDADEAALQAELAALTEAPVEAETSLPDVEIAAEEPVAETPAPVETEADISTDVSVEDTPTTRRADALPDNNDAAMSRIMDQADEELSNPEGSRRRAAIAQLKAAVAATEAARQLGDDKTKAASAEEAFREDLDKVVRPRRAPKPATVETPRSDRPRPGPLKLVASQRVDVAPASETGAVRPRRVAMADPAVQSDASSFAAFAEEMGATELPDLLEAAAAYTAYVEGENEFSRPQIMRKVQASSDAPFTREDGLRSFGTLLRLGRISKAGNGRFQVSDQTRFKPEQKAG